MDPEEPGVPAPHRLAGFLGDTNPDYFEGAVERAAVLAEASEEELIALLMPTDRKQLVQPEFQRRQIVAADRLRQSMESARASADNAARRLILLTVALVVMTAVLVWLTVVLVTHDTRPERAPLIRATPKPRRRARPGRRVGR